LTFEVLVDGWSDNNRPTPSNNRPKPTTFLFISQR